MDTPSFLEDHISQIPALQFLQNIGYTYLTPEEIKQYRKDKTTAVLLEDILYEQLKKINKFQYKKESYRFTEKNIKSGIQALKEAPLQEGFITANEYIYNLLTLGKSFEQTINGDTKSYDLRYIDWENWKNNVFHVAEEYSVMRSVNKEHYRPDIVLFINGIPIVVIECKRPDQKDNIPKAISQHLRNQQEDGIRSLFIYSQLLISIATNVAAYATTATIPKFWSLWTEQQESTRSKNKYEKELARIKNTPLSTALKDRLFNDRFKYVRYYFDAMESATKKVTEQDYYLYNLCQPKRLLDLIHNYIVYDAGIKKIARYQQYFAIGKTINKIKTIENGKRTGGVIWHTQGSGKSLTMVMLAQAIALHKDISNPKIVIVTDRTDLDDQIFNTFEKCDLAVIQSNTGKHLLTLLKSKSDFIITTIINKFKAAVKSKQEPLTSPNIFVLIDEGHRTQYGTFNVSMRRTFPNACFIAFTGTPLKKMERNTANKFGGIIDSYTVDQAVKDKAVVPLLYEGRHALQEVNEAPLNTYFDKVSEPLTKYQKADLKRKFSRAEQLNIAEQKIYVICWDISTHYKDNWQGTGFKGQLVCPNKIAAIKYKDHLDDIGIVSTEIVISSPDMREGEDSAYAKTPESIQHFWNKMMQEHGSAKKYAKNIISRFKHQKDPEIIIVVDKLLTGFDAPNNIVLYITRNLKEHTLLQTIARVNRIAEGKDYGYIIDYYGVTEELYNTLQNYSSEEADDIEGVLTNVNEEIKKLPQVHSELWDFFKTVKNKYDEPAYEEVLEDIAIRVAYYDRLGTYAKILKLALSTVEWYDKTPEKEIDRYKFDLGFFTKLRAAVKNLYSDTIDFKSYEKQIQKLIDKHVTSHEVKPITELVNIFETEKFEEELEKVTGKAAKAKTIASRTAKHASEKMEEDPAYYKKLSDLIKETIKAYKEKRISESEFLERMTNAMDAAVNHTRDDIPDELKDRKIAQAFYGLSLDFFDKQIKDEATKIKIAAITGLHIDDLIREYIIDKATNAPKRDWVSNKDLKGQLEIAIGDFLLDEIKDKYKINLSFGDINNLAEKYLTIALIRYKG